MRATVLAALLVSACGQQQQAPNTNFTARLTLVETRAELCQLARARWVGGEPKCVGMDGWASWGLGGCRIYMTMPRSAQDMPQFAGNLWHEIRHCTEGRWHD